MKKLLRLALLVGVLTGGTWFSLGAIERQMVYPFDATRVSPASAGLSAMLEQVIKINAVSLIVWTHPAKAQKPTILYFHGNAGNLANRAGRFRRFMDRGYGVIAPAYRGSSGSTGKPSEQKLTRDARYIYRQLDRLIPGLSPAHVVVYGESLGTGVALKTIASAKTQQPAAVVLEAPYTTLPEVAVNLDPRLESLTGKMKNIWNSRKHVKSLTAPLLVLHGTRDRLIPTDQGRQVFAAAPSRVKRFFPVKGAGHNDIWRSDSLPVLWKFIDRQALSIR